MFTRRMHPLRAVLTLSILWAIVACTAEKTITDEPGTPDVGPPGVDVMSGCQNALDCVGQLAVASCQRLACLSGTCTTEPATDGIPCTTGATCLTNQTCFLGQCQGGLTYGCDDGNGCTTDSCDPVLGCQHLPSGGGCDDGNPCTLADHCINAVCTGGNSACPCISPEQCDQWNDNNVCNGSVTCLSGVCQLVPGSAVSCAQQVVSQCETVGCDAITGQCVVQPIADGTPCNDGELCTGPDTCVLGQCVSGPAACGCVTDADCLAFDDGNLCNGIRRCVSGQCAADPTSVVQCGSGGDACAAGACDPQTGQCQADPLPQGSPCDDQNGCTVNDSCGPTGCVGQAISCNDENPCTSDTCNLATGTCVSTPLAGSCDDGNVCTAVDVCQNGVCVGQQDQCVCDTNPQCAAYEDADPCTGPMICLNHMCVPDPALSVYCDSSLDSDCMANTCNPVNGLCSIQPINEGGACFDGDPCTESDTCVGGQCKGLAMAGCACNPLEPLPCNTSNKTWANDAFGSTNTINVWPCSPGDYSGNEYAWVYTPTTSTWVTVDLSDEAVDTEVFVLEDQGSGCIPSACTAQGAASVGFGAKAGKTYYVVVDGKLGANGKFDITVGCDTSAEFDCSNGLDDDMDGKADCNDDDCTNNPSCTFGEDCSDGQDNNGNSLIDCVDPGCWQSPECVETCYPQGTAYCGLSQYWETGGYKSENELENYACGDILTGPDFAYTFHSSTNQMVTVTTPQVFTGHRIVVLQEQNNQCTSGGCVTSGVSQVTFMATAGVTYYLVIDGENGMAGSYHLKVKCEQ